MIDINFYRQLDDLKEHTIESFESIRSKNPTIYNIETTNACNMKCTMCPRTTKMTRKIKTMGLDTFKNIVPQIQAWSESD